MESRISADASVGGATETVTVDWLVAALPPSIVTAFVTALAGTGVTSRPPLATSEAANAAIRTGRERWVMRAS